MFLNQINFMWRDLGRANGRRTALLLLLPYAVFVLLALGTVLRPTPIVADHAEFSGTGTRTIEQIHLRDSYRIAATITGQAGCSASLMIGGRYGFTLPSFPSDATTGRQQVATWDLTGVADGLYRIDVTATGCGPWTVTLDRE